MTTKRPAAPEELSVLGQRRRGRLQDLKCTTKEDAGMARKDWNPEDPKKTTLVEVQTTPLYVWYVKKK